MKLLLRFLLPTLIGLVIAPRLIAYMYHSNLHELIRPFEIEELVMLPLVAGGLLVFVLPASRQTSLRSSGSLFFVSMTVAGLVGGILMASLLLVIASFGVRILETPILGFAFVLGGSLGAVTAATWALFNLPRSMQHG